MPLVLDIPLFAIPMPTGRKKVQKERFGQKCGFSHIIASLADGKRLCPPALAENQVKTTLEVTLIDNY